MFGKNYDKEIEDIYKRLNEVVKREQNLIE